jgi:hypothetical protein
LKSEFILSSNCKKKKNYKTEPKGGTGELINMEKNKQTNEMKEKKSLEK